MGKAVSWIFATCAVAATALLFAVAAGFVNLGERLAAYIEAIGVAGGVLVALWGLQTWRHEMVGKRRAELAEEVLAAFYQARDEIIAIRSPGSTTAESAGRPREETEDDRTARDRDSYYVPLARFNKKAEFWAKLYALRYRYMAVFGKDNAKPFDLLHSVVVDIRVAAEMLIADARAMHYRPQNAETEASIAKDKATIWAHPRQQDELTRTVDGAVSAIEETCVRFITANNS